MVQLRLKPNSKMSTSGGTCCKRWENNIDNQKRRKRSGDLGENGV
jgi:hypothetical protein